MRTLRQGGNAVDAALAVNAVLGVVAPQTCGIGGDLFALVHRPGELRPAVLNASGRAGSEIEPGELTPFHPNTVTVPGCVDGWSELAAVFGRRALTEVLAPAIAIAEGGFPVSNELARALDARREQLRGQPSAEALYPGGAPPTPGTVVRRPDLAVTLRLIASEGPAGFYQGPPGRAISEAVGGRVILSDLARQQADWVEPVGVDLFGRTGWSVPPNSQGYVTLAAAAIFERLSPPREPNHPDFVHAQIESYRAAAAERDELVADPRYAPLSADQLLARERLDALAASVSMAEAGRFAVPPPVSGGTAYMGVLDRFGMGISLIQSNFMGLGVGLGAGTHGFFLHNRGAGFNLVPGHPNELAPGKRPLHTLSPTLWTKEGRLDLLLGSRGGHQQPQLLLQVATRLLWSGQAPAVAQAGPRWTMEDFAGGRSSSISVEADLGEPLVDELRRRGHRVEVVRSRQSGWGPVGIIAVGDPPRAAADPRVDTASAQVT